MVRLPNTAAADAGRGVAAWGCGSGAAGVGGGGGTGRSGSGGFTGGGTGGVGGVGSCGRTSTFARCSGVIGT